jgi:Spy/CpxP family protein refolding chaperone
MTDRSRIMAAVTVFMTLLLGVAIGVAADRTLLHSRRPDFRGRGGPFGMLGAPADTAMRNQMRTRVITRVTRELSLTPAQVSQISAIFARGENRLDSVRVSVSPRLDSVRMQMRAAIDSVLTPEQRVKFAAARQRMEGRRRER